MGSSRIEATGRVGTHVRQPCCKGDPEGVRGGVLGDDSAELHASFRFEVASIGSWGTLTGAALAWAVWFVELSACWGKLSRRSSGLG